MSLSRHNINDLLLKSNQIKLQIWRIVTTLLINVMFFEYFLSHTSSHLKQLLILKGSGKIGLK